MTTADPPRANPPTPDPTTARPASPVGVEPGPQRIGPFTLLERLGSGGSATVYRARLDAPRTYAALGAVVAVKVVTADATSDPQGVERFARECELAVRIDHPAVVRCYESGGDEPPAGSGAQRWLAMEYIEGHTLGQVMSELGAVPEPLLRDIGHKVAAGLAAVHAAGAVHRDVKPANVMLTPSFDVKLMDLGAARPFAARQRLTRAGTFVGTLLYAAPEQFRGGAVSPAADLYSLGIVLYEAATGVQPFEAGDLATVIRLQLEHVPARIGTINPQLSPFLEELVACLLLKEPERRFASASALHEVLARGEASTWWRSQEPAVRSRHPRGSLRRVRVARDVPLVGRTRELGELVDGFVAANAGRGQVWLVDGEAGVGKSRLLEAFLQQLERRPEDHQVLFGAYLPNLAGAQRGGLAEALLEHAGPVGLESALGRWLGHAHGLAARFATVLTGSGSTVRTDPADPAVPGDPAEPLPEDVVQALFCQVLKTLAEERTVVWVVEDVQFASREGRALILALARVVPDRRILLMVTRRPGTASPELAALNGLPWVHRLTVPRLDPAGVELLLSEVLRSRIAAARATPAVVRRSDGNPLFVLALIRDLRERPTDLGDRAVDTELVPLSVKELLTTRLADTSDAERSLLDVAAVLGFAFDPELLARALDRRRLDVLQSLAQLERRTQLVRAAGAEFTFDHHLLQELLYGDLPPSLRAEYHGLLADAVRARLAAAGTAEAGIADEAASFLTDHYLKAGRTADARRTLHAALHHLRVQDRTEALIHLTHDMVERLGDTDPELACDLLLTSIEPLHRLGRRNEERANLERAIRLADRLGDQSRLARAEILRAVDLRTAGDLDGARLAARSALEYAVAAGNRGIEAEASGVLGLVQLVATELDAAADSFRRCAELYEAIDSAIGKGGALRNLGRVELLRGRHRAALDHFEASLEALRAVGNRVGIGLVHGTRSVLLANIGEERRALVECAQHWQLAREGGNRIAEANGLHIQGDIEIRLGRLEAAREHLEQAIALAREVGEGAVEMAATHAFGRLWHRLGRLDRAREVYQRNHRLVDSQTERRWEAAVETDVGLLALSEGNLDEATARLDRAIATAASRRLPSQVYQAQWARGLVARAAGDDDRAESWLRAALAGQDSIDERGPAALTALGLGALLLGRARDEAVALLERAEAYAQRDDYGYFGTLPTAYLALAGERDPTTVQPSPASWVEVRIETLLTASRAGRSDCLAPARAELATIAARLPKAARPQLWQHSLLGRLLRQAEHDYRLRQGDSHPIEPAAGSSSPVDGSNDQRL